jgi:hypothetical protein
MRVLVPGICAVIWVIGLVPLSRGATAVLPSVEDNVLVALPPFASTATFYSSGNNQAKPYVCVGIQTVARTPGKAPEANAVFTLMRFDLATLPKTAKIGKAWLVLKTISAYPRLDGNYVFWVEQISSANADWIQGKGTSITDCNPEDCYDTSVGYYRKLVSYRDAGHHTGEPWASGPGVFGREGDIAFVDGKHSVNDLLSAGRVWRLEMKPGTVQGWLTNSSLARAGLAVHLEGPTPAKNFWIQFYSRQHPDPESISHIEVEYTQ